MAPNHILFSCCIHISPWSAGMTSLIILVVVDISEFSAPISDMLYSHNAITSQLCLLAVNFNGGKMFCPYKPNFTMNCTGPSFWCHCRCTSASLLNQIWLLCHLLYVTCTTSATSYQKIKCLQQKLQAGVLYLMNMSGVMGYSCETAVRDFLYNFLFSLCNFMSGKNTRQWRVF